MIPNEKINDLVSRLRDAGGQNLRSVVLYGSAAAGDYIAGRSDFNILCVVTDASLSSLQSLSSAIQWWAKQRHRPPLVLTSQELQRGADVFSIEFLDMKQNHKLLWGEDLLAGLAIPMQAHRTQLEYELREKSIVLRQHLLLAARESEQVWSLVLHSLSSFATLFRHALLAMGEPVTPAKREAVQLVQSKLKIDTSAFLALLDIREGKADRKSASLNDLVGRYLGCIEQVTSAVDRMLDSPSTRE